MRFIYVAPLIYNTSISRENDISAHLNDFYGFKELSLIQRMPFRLLVGLVLLLIVVAAEPQVALFILALGYVLSGPFTTLFNRRAKKVVVHNAPRKGEEIFKK